MSHNYDTVKIKKNNKSESACAWIKSMPCSGIIHILNSFVFKMSTIFQDIDVEMQCIGILPLARSTTLFWIPVIQTIWNRWFDRNTCAEIQVREKSPTSICFTSFRRNEYSWICSKENAIYTSLIVTTRVNVSLAWFVLGMIYRCHICRYMLPFE